jgi:ubiquinone/menaquinone biosynthesis C-methylase UbiE
LPSPPAAQRGQKPSEFFDANVDDYDAKHYGGQGRTFMTVRQARVLELVDGLRIPEGARVLDAGCGPGHLLVELAKRGLAAVGADASVGMLCRARERVRAWNPRSGAWFQQASIERLPYRDGAFELICSTGVIEYLKDDRHVLAEFFRVLRPGGHLILPVTNFWSPVNSLDWVTEFLKRQRWLQGVLNRLGQGLGHGPVLPRHFRVRRHRPAALRRALTAAGFRVVDGMYFHFLPWPRPIDRLLPRASNVLGERLERFGRSSIGPLAEGFLTLAVKPR